MRRITDPIELIVSKALDEKGVHYIHGSEKRNNNKGLDFYLPDFDLFIEVKRFHTDRINDQTKRVDNIIVIQGIKAAQTFAMLINNIE